MNTQSETQAIATQDNIDYTLLNQKQAITVLAVEDDMLSMKFLEAQIGQLGHKMLCAENGQIALEILQKHNYKIDVVLMDREMPVMDGLSAVRQIKSHPALRNIPVIMVTGADGRDELKEGLDAGVFYYLTKPVDEILLQSVLSAAVRESEQKRILAEELGKHRTSFHLIETCKFKFKTLSEAESLAAFMANCFPDSARVLTGLGELLINAVEHGNLGVTYDQKTEMISAGTWRAEINRLQKLPQHEPKTASATIAHKEDGIYAVIEDQGTGFSWQDFINIDPARAGDNHGRGIAQARAVSFDRLSFNEKGNKAVAFVSHKQQLNW